MLKFLKRFKFDFFRFRGEYGLGIGLCKWSLSLELFMWHFSVEFLTDSARANSERVRKFLNDITFEEWDV